MSKFVIIVAGGSGQRMKSAVPKQFLKINQEIILMKSISAFYKYDENIKIVLALPQDQISFWKELCSEYQFQIEHTIVAGGQTRFHSVKNALEQVSGVGIVAIHDGVRPLVSVETIKLVFETAKDKGNAIPYIDLVDSIRFVDEMGNKPLDRNKYKLIQTPQAFDIKAIKKSYQQNCEESFTDDASVAEKMGQKINLVQGNSENIKITSKVDLKIAEILSNYLSE